MSWSKNFSKLKSGRLVPQTPNRQYHQGTLPVRVCVCTRVQARLYVCVCVCVTSALAKVPENSRIVANQSIK